MKNSKPNKNIQFQLKAGVISNPFDSYLAKQHSLLFVANGLPPLLIYSVPQFLNSSKGGMATE